MATLEQQFDWLKEVLEEEPKTFADYYKDDFSNYLDIEEINKENLKELLSSKFEKLTKCESKEEVRDFISKVTGYVVMKAQIGEIIHNYFNS